MKKIRLGCPAVSVDEKLCRAVERVLKSGQWSPGPRVREFETAWAKLHKAREAVFVNSGTDALRIALLALKEKYGWKDGDEIAVPALTFVATVNVILQAGLKPFFVDVGMTDYTINPWNLARRVQEKHTKLVGIVPVHLFGQDCSTEVFEVAQRYKLKVLEDCCETAGNPLRGDASCYSTYMAHHVTTGVGGLAVTNDVDLHWLMRSYANHGRNSDMIPGYTTGEITVQGLLKRFNYPRIGFSARPTEFEAVLGLAQIRGLNRMLEARKRVAEQLWQALEPVVFNKIHLPKAVRRHTWMMFPLVIREDVKLDREKLCLHLEKDGIETRPMMPVTNQPCYRGLVNEDDYPVAQWINRCGFYIPCHPGMGAREVEQVTRAFRTFLTK